MAYSVWLAMKLNKKCSGNVSQKSLSVLNTILHFVFSTQIEGSRGPFFNRSRSFSSFTMWGIVYVLWCAVFVSTQLNTHLRLSIL